MAVAKHIADAQERVTEYIDSLPDFSKKICSRLREIILKSDPKIIEDWKWGPNYYLDGMICGYAAFKKHVNFVFFKGALLKDKRKLMTDTGSLTTRHFRITHANEIDEDILLEYIFEAIDNNKAGKKVEPLKHLPVPLTTNIQKEFKSAGVLKLFEALAPSHKKQYQDWIEQSKKEETRKNRIAKTIEMLGKKSSVPKRVKK